MTQSIGIAIFLAIAVTLIIRLVPILFLADKKFPNIVKQWLMFVPIPIFTAIVANGVINDHAQTSFGVSVGLAAALLSFLITLIWKNLLVAAISSIGFYLLFQYTPKITEYFISLKNLL